MINTDNIETDKLIYIRHTESDSVEPHKIVFEFNSGPEIKDFKIICMRLAAALGYDWNVIINSFGNISDESLFEHLTQEEKDKLKESFKK